MDAAASLITIVDLSISISSACVKYVREVSHAAEEASALHEELGSLLLVISRLQLPSVSSPMRIELEQDIEICHRDLLSLQGKLKPAKGFGKLRQSLIWPFKKSGEFKNTSIRIQKHLNIFEKAVTISTLEITEEIKAELAEFRTDRESDRDFIADKFDVIEEHVNDIKESMGNLEKEKLLKWLNAIDCESDYRHNVSLAAPSTGSWFLEDTGYFAQWMGCVESSPRHILIQAGTGAGKTVLMSTAVQAALAYPLQPSSNIYVGYYYFDFRSKSTPSSMLRSLFYQVITRMSSSPEAIEELRNNYPASDTVPVSELTRVLHQQYSRFDTTFLFIDALDECEKVNELLEVISNLSGTVGPLVDVRFMCFSRDEGAIKRILESSGFSSRPLESTTVVQDIEAYVKETLHNDSSGMFEVLQSSPEGLRRDVPNTLVQRSEGMFRWVQCQLDEISHCRTAREIRNAINNLPPTLTETYEQIFKRMSKSDLSKAQRILSWLIGASKPMTTNMLVEALTIDVDKLDLDQEDRLRSPDEIRDICRSLVRESNHHDKESWPDCKIITLAHFSVEQYLLSPEAKKFRLDLRMIHLQLSRACLAYSTSLIWEPILDSMSEDNTCLESRAEAVQFLAYTCGEIFSHLQYQNVEYELVPHVIDLLQQDGRLLDLRRNCRLLNIWWTFSSYPFDMNLNINDEDGPLENEISWHIELSHSSSFLSKSVVAGLYPTYFSLIGQGFEFNTIDEHYQTPLAFIVAAGRIDLIQRYILGFRAQYQVAVSHSPGEAKTVLESILICTVNGVFTAIIMKWMDAFHELFNDALRLLDLFHDFSASSRMYRKMIYLCVTLDAKEGTDEISSYVLSHASSSGRLSAEAVNQMQEELLYAFVRLGKAEHVQKLIASGVCPSVRVNTTSYLKLMRFRNSRITLEEANRYWTCYLDPRVLLSQMDTDSRDWHYWEEKREHVIMAAMEDHKIARILIQGRHEEILDNKNVLIKAVKSWLLAPPTQQQTDDLEVLRSLLYEYLQDPQNKAKINMALVICSGDKAGTQPVRQLLARGADPNCSIHDEDYRDASTPLVAACNSGSAGNIGILLDAGADPNLESESGIVPSVAVFTSWLFEEGILDKQRVFDLLRHYKPELMTNSTKGLSKPLPTFNRYYHMSRSGSVFSALMFGNEIPLEFLESNGLLAHLDDYLPGDEYGTPLIAAAATGKEDLVDLLLERGATINTPGHPEMEWSHPVLAAIFGKRWDLALRFLRDFELTSITNPGEQRKWSMALMVSLEAGNQDVALRLIQGGIKINFADDQEASSFVLEKAKEYDFKEMFGVAHHLCDMGTPIYAACKGGNPTLIKALQDLEAREVPTLGASFGDCLTAACSSFNVEAVEMFLQTAGNINKCTPGRERWCPLVSALQSGYFGGSKAIVSLLLSKGVQANISYPFENSAVDPRSLETMIFSHDRSLHFTLLWKRMWDDGKITGSSILHAKPFFGNPFIAAIAGRDNDIIDLLAKQEGVDVNLKERRGIYPTAMMATLDMSNSHKVTRPLRQLGATGITASQMLNFTHPFRAVDDEVVQDNVSLAIHGSFWGNIITLCVNLEMAIPYLLMQGADPNQVIPGSFYGSALIAASALLCSETMMHFLDHGCDVNAVVSESTFGTPLIAACAGPAHYPFQWNPDERFNLRDPYNWSVVQYDMLELLVLRGADVNAAHNELTPLIALVLCDCKEVYKIAGLKLLLENGADPDVTLPQLGYSKVTAGKQWSAISIVEQKGEESIRRILIEGREARELSTKVASIPVSTQ